MSKEDKTVNDGAIVIDCDVGFIGVVDAKGGQQFVCLTHTLPPSR